MEIFKIVAFQEEQVLHCFVFTYEICQRVVSKRLSSDMCIHEALTLLYETEPIYVDTCKRI